MNTLKNNVVQFLKQQNISAAGFKKRFENINFGSIKNSMLFISKRYRLPSLRQGQWAIALVCVVLGIMLAVQFRTTQDIRSTIPYQRVEDLSQRLSQTEKERDALLKQIKEMRNSSSIEAATREMELIKMSAGAVAVEGPGVIVTIDDSKKPTRPGDNLNVYLIHDDDVLKIINELRASGAEALSINDQRLTGSSEIRCAGTTVSVNNTRVGPPYEVKAIGDPQTLENGLKMRGGVVETLQFFGIQVTIKKQDQMKIPAFKGAFRFEIAKPVKEESK